MVTKPLFKDATYILNKICILPYTEDEMKAIGKLGHNMTKNRHFGDEYMNALNDRQYSNESPKRVAFAELNLQLYRQVLQQPDLEQIPEQIIMPTATPKGDIRSRIDSIRQKKFTLPPKTR